MLITADQVLCHFFGDYLLQSDWMATEKTKRSIAALCHVLTYMLPFLFLRPSLPALLVIVSTHFIIDRWRLARYVVWAKNFLAPRSTVALVQVLNMPEAQSPGGMVNQYQTFQWWRSWRECAGTGYPPERPAWLAVWLLIIADNIMHIVINGAALKWL